ncbi:hypothetical protein LUZ63_017493 [Rhynchospora breviuscula]|uniref:DUF7054 domain-containing protein n=1 Tax=Rhynchospora breviuscula TaxID=2022672 RepID=A0A9Q0C2K1_9POAL|nr:hypothetical protein LUZ63_017493 [Rhynchospora breviuscula]
MAPVQSSSRSGMANKTSKPQRSSSFHGKIVPPEMRQLRRPMTNPDLLAAARTNRSSPEIPIRDRSSPAPGRGVSGGADEAVRKTPVKVLLNVTVQRSMWPLQVMAFSEWSVTDLVAAVLRQYVKEGRRPQLNSADPSSYGLHYSQFSLECLDSEEKLIGLGSRNFFLCPKEPVVSDSVTANGTPASASCSNQAGKASKTAIPWLRFMEFLL